ncbi:MAG: Verru_Chthon cassette protein D [Prosthecobacter sp.]|nr:Verru_Chthon cassette protein D [Prosthecobacter sp.]MDI1314143.1 Verru_Chthon cassette protein D [Prosthecobacter sp.]
MKILFPTQHSSRSSRRDLHHPPTGFSLVEMVIVVAIVTMLIAVATPYTLGALQSANLTSAGDTLMQKFAMVQQRSLTENRPVGLDFYYYDNDNIKGCHAVQMISFDPATNLATPLEPPVYFNKQNVVLVEGPLSPMFSTNQTASSTGSATLNPFQALGATFHRVIFYPNGSTSLRVPLRTAYLTLISTKSYQADLSEAPPNFYTVQIDPVTGRGHSHRP